MFSARKVFDKTLGGESNTDVSPFRSDAIPSGFRRLTTEKDYLSCLSRAMLSHSHQGYWQDLTYPLRESLESRP